MYSEFYGLREAPFDLTPNPRFLFLTHRHREALGNLQYGLLSAKAITLLIGQAGTGKTTLLRTALEAHSERRIRCIYLNNPALTRSEFVEFLARKFELPPHARESKAAMLLELEQRLLDDRKNGVVSALIVDEAQALSYELLEEIRLLANVETATEKLLPVVLAGQPELAAKLDDPALRQLKQRVALRCEISPLDLQETAAYIASRIRTAGGDCARLFTREAVCLVYERSGGIPRLISVICDNALVNGFALGRQPVGRDLVADVCADFALPPPESERSIAQATREPRMEIAAESVKASEPGADTSMERELFVQTLARRRRFSIFG